MTDSEANEIRLIANEIMRRLYEASQRSQLDLLRMYAVRAIEKIDKKPNEQVRRDSAAPGGNHGQ